MIRVGSFTQEPGAHWGPKKTVLAGYSGVDGGGTPVQADRLTEIDTGYSVKGANHDPITIVNGFKMPKDYQRLIFRLDDVGPSVFREKSKRDQYQIDFTSWPTGPLEPPDHPQDLGSDAESESTTKALNNLRGKNRIQLGASLAESRQVVDMIAGNTSTVLNAYRAGRRGNWGSIPRILGMDSGSVLTGKFTANKWLEYQYGWKPLLGDIYSGYTALKEGFRTFGPPIYMSSGTGRRTSSRSVIVNGYEMNIDYEWFCNTKLWYRVTNSTIDTIDSAGLLNPASVAWELIPYSFVIDWFVPIGNVLSALSATAGLEFFAGKRSSISTKVLKSTEVQRENTEDGYSYYSHQKQGHYGSTSFKFYRKALSGFPNPQIYTNPNPFSTAHVKNALALLRNLF